jgi:hypothetical protein
MTRLRVITARSRPRYRLSARNNLSKPSKTARSCHKSVACCTREVTRLPVNQSPCCVHNDVCGCSDRSSSSSTSSLSVELLQQQQQLMGVSRFGISPDLLFSCISSHRETHPFSAAFNSTTSLSPTDVGSVIGSQQRHRVARRSIVRPSAKAMLGDAVVRGPEGGL